MFERLPVREKNSDICSKEMRNYSCGAVSEFELQHQELKNGTEFPFHPDGFGTPMIE
jgi:hypothetical protein